MNDYKYLIKNIGVLTISRFATKFLTFFLVPLYTEVLTTEEYGIYDLYGTTIILLVPILTLSIASGTARFLLDSAYEKNQVLRCSIKYILLSILLFVSFIVINRTFNVIPELNKFILLFFLMYLVSLFDGWLVSVARGMELIRDISIASIIASCVAIVSNIVFLLVFKWGIKGYFIANILGGTVSNAYYIFRAGIIKRLNSSFAVDKLVEREIRSYSAGMVLNSVSWWINNSLDRYIVLYMCTVGEVGILSVAYKIPVIISTIQGIFEHAWFLSIVKNYDKEDSNRFIINIYNAYNLLIITMASVLITTTKLLASLLYRKDFYDAWILVPYLVLAAVFSSSSGVTGGILVAEKKSGIISSTTMIGAVVNIISSILITYYFGVIGVAIGTMLSYLVVAVFRIYYVRKIMVLRLSIARDCMSYAVLLVQIMLLYYGNKVIYLGGLLSLVIIIFLYKDEIIRFFSKMFLNKEGDSK